jgi:hypothetical protein
VFGFLGKRAERPGGTAPLNLQEAVTDDRLAVPLVEVVGSAGREGSMVNGQCLCCAFRTAGSSSSGATITTTNRKLPILVLRLYQLLIQSTDHGLAARNAFRTLMGVGVDHLWLSSRSHPADARWARPPIL